MKRVIRASLTPSEKLHKIVDYMLFEGVSEHTMLSFFFDELPAQQSMDMMYELARQCDVDLEEVDE